MTLWDKFLYSTQPSSVKWKIYGRNRKLLCADYGSLKKDDLTLDNAEVIKAEIKYTIHNKKYVRVVVDQ